MASETLHESSEVLDPPTIDFHRAISSLMEELEAIDWYNQRAKATTDAELRKILEHNRDEEKEHAAMVLEWLRRRDAIFDAHLRTYLFSEGSLSEIEEQASDGATEESSADTAPNGLNIGSLKGEPQQ